MAVPVLDNSAYAVGSGLSSITISGFTVSGSNRYLLVGAGGYDASFGPDVTGVTRTGSSHSQIGEANDGPGDYAFLWGGVAPATGAVDTTVTCALANDVFGIVVMSFTGVDQTNPVSKFTSAYGPGGGSSPTLTVASPATDELLVDCGYFYDTSDNTFDVGANQTQIQQQAMATNDILCLSHQSYADGGVMSWGNADTTEYWVLVACALLGVSGGGGGANPWYYYAQQMG